MKFKPLYNNILIKRVEQEQKTAGGIIIPDSAQEKPMQGEVVAVGTGTVHENGSIRPLEVKEGNIVLFAKWAGSEIKLDGEDYIIMKETEVLGILN